MKNARSIDTLRRGGLFLLILVTPLFSGCTDAVFDAAAAGGLGFLQSGVATTLSDIVFGQDTQPMTADTMSAATDMTMEGHGG